MIGKMMWSLIAFLSGIMAGGIAVPVLSVFVRLAGLIPNLVRLFGRVDMVMYLGGIVFGLPVAAVVLTLMLRAMGEEDRRVVIIGAVGGAVGGLASSIMFFPIIGFL